MHFIENSVFPLLHFNETCEQHGDKIISIFLKYSTKLLVNNYCNAINRQLNGKITKSNPNDIIKKNTVKYFQTHKLKQKKNKSNQEFITIIVFILFIFNYKLIKITLFLLNYIFILFQTYLIHVTLFYF